jgi:hypothetical protein
MNKRQGYNSLIVETVKTVIEQPIKLFIYFRHKQSRSGEKIVYETKNYFLISSICSPSATAALAVAVAASAGPGSGALIHSRKPRPSFRHCIEQYRRRAR